MWIPTQGSRMSCRSLHPMAASKISVSVADEELSWARKEARNKHLSLSAVVTEALRLARQAEARERLLVEFGDAAKATPDELAQIYREWQAD